MSFFGETSKSKGYKLASKYHLMDVGGIVHVLTKGGGGVVVPVERGEGEGDHTSGADDVGRLVPEGELFDVLRDTHVDAGGHCKGRTFDQRVKTRYVGIPRCMHAAPSHPTSSYTILPHPIPSHPT